MENQVGYGQDDAVYCALVHDLLQGYHFIKLKLNNFIDFKGPIFHFVLLAG